MAGSADTVGHNSTSDIHGDDSSHTGLGSSDIGAGNNGGNGASDAVMASELAHLGVDVVNQSDLEQGLIAEADERMAREEAELSAKRIEKFQREMITVEDDINRLERNIQHLRKVRPDDHALRSRLEREKNDKTKKLQEMKSLENEVLSGGLYGDEAAAAKKDREKKGAGLREILRQQRVAQMESERERLVRTGFVTPFGTAIRDGSVQASAYRPLPNALPKTPAEKEKERIQRERSKGAAERKRRREDDAENAHKNSAKIARKSPSCKDGAAALGSTDVASGGAASGGASTEANENVGDDVEGDADVDVTGLDDAGAVSRGVVGGSKGAADDVAAGKTKKRPTQARAASAPKRRRRLVRRRRSGGESGNSSSSSSHESDDGHDSDGDYVVGGRFDGDLDKGLVEGESDEDEEGEEEKESDEAWIERHSLAAPRKISVQPDDGNEKMYFERVGRWRTLRAKARERKERRRRRRVESGLPADAADDDEDGYFTPEESDGVDTDEEFAAAAVDERIDFLPAADPDVPLNDDIRIPGEVWAALFPYQRVAVKWLSELRTLDCGGIVGDEMGLGKTVQVIAFLAALRYSRALTGPVLIVCPATIMHQWVAEFHKWWPGFKVAIFHESGSSKDNRDGKSHALDCVGEMSGGVLITTYSAVRLSLQALLRYRWAYVILDEGHKIRNPDAEVTIACKQFPTQNRIILSGSPIQNNLRELWSLFDFVYPGKLGTLPVFIAQFAVPISLGGYASASLVQVQTAYKCACVLRDTIGPYMIRRLKNDVEIQLPAKNEQVLFCRLTADQRRVYTDFLKSQDVTAILGGKRHVLYGIDIIRKICNHPALVGYTGLRGDVVHGGNNRRGADGDDGDDEDDPFRAELSGKMLVVDSLLRLWHAQGHRVLVFTQTRQMLDILERAVKKSGYNYRRMDGNTPIARRQPLISEFNASEGVFVFLLTTKVGGLGINLTGADRIVIYDPDWNPSTDLQARERAWRIGQKRPVTIYRLLTSGTIEEKIYHRQIFKQFLTNKILRDPRQRRFFKQNDLHELFTLGHEHAEHTETGEIFADTDPTLQILPSSMVGEKGAGKPKTRGNGKGKGRGKSSRGMRHSDDEDANADGSGDDDLSFRRRSAEGDGGGASGATDPDVAPGTISGLVRRDAYMVPKDEVEENGGDVGGGGGEGAKAQHAKDDDYILSTLFKTSGVHSALRHDSIMETAKPEAALVQREAERIAQSAVQALRESRDACMGASVGMPTWTGRSGAAGAPSGAAVKRFGKTVSASSPKHYTDAGRSSAGGGASTPPMSGPGSVPSTPPDTNGGATQKRRSTPNLFGGTGLLDTYSVDSATLLQRMRDKRGDSVADAERIGLARDLRRHILMAGGSMTTERLVEKFQARVRGVDAGIFKEVLKEIATLVKVGGVGVWQLKEEFE